MDATVRLSSSSERAVIPVVVTVSNASDVNQMYLKTHNLSYDGKASVRVNGGGWVNLDNSVVTCRYPESNMGCVGGAYHTIRFTLPVSGVRNGDNVIEFAFNGSDGISTGYRVLEIDLRRNGQSAIDGTSFVYDDPTQWTTPRSSSSDISAGRDIWAARNSLVKHPGGSAISASCADCHTADGRDLKYFNYSNKSIIVRSVFHGLSEVEGEQIASYIRSIDLRRENGQSYEAPGSPWDPPYQPGPGIDSRPVEEWASGAGLEWVLENDIESLPYLFPNGINADAARVGAILNLREIPLALQFPDWNNWLPDVHPMDFYGSAFLNHDVWRTYNVDLQNALESGDLAEIDIQQKWFNTYAHQVKGLSPAQSATDAEKAAARLSSKQWALIKTWESMHGYHLEDKADDLYSSFREPRAWIGRQRVLFDLAPHIVSVNGLGNPPYTYGTRSNDSWFSHVWYHLQLIVNPGSDPASSAQTPVDWGYQASFIRGGSNAKDYPAGIRAVSSWIKKTQMLADNDAGLEHPRGWGPQQVNPYFIVRMLDTSGKSPGLFMNLDASLKRDLLEATLRAWLDHISSFDPDEFPRGDGKSDYEPATHIPSNDINMQYEFANYVYAMLPRLANAGVSLSLINDIAAWGASMWPNGDWGVSSNPSPNQAPRIEIISPATDESFEAGSRVDISVDADDPDGSLTLVEFYANGTKIGQDATEPYNYAWNNVEAGSHSITARATDNDDARTTSSPIEIAVGSGAPPPPPPTGTQGVDLRQGWNMVSSYVAPTTPNMADVFASIKPNIELVKDEAGNQYHPQSGLNTIGDWSSLESYQIYAHSPQTLSLEGTAIDLSSPISLVAGWNLVPYFATQEISVEEALASIADEVTLVKDYAGRVYYPEFAINEIGSMRPGEGYKVHTDVDATLVYPAAGTVASKSASSRFDPFGVASSATLILEVPDYASGMRITALGPLGQVIGESIANNGKALVRIVGDDELTASFTEGAVNGESITLKGTLPGAEEEFTIQPDRIESGLEDAEVRHSLTYAADEVLLVQIATLPQQIELEQNFPNPFSRSTSIRYTLSRPGRVRLELFNVVGEKVAVVIDEEQDRGPHTVFLDGTRLASGVYYYRLIADDAIKNGQMMRVK